jgi:L-lactate permease
VFDALFLIALLSAGLAACCGSRTAAALLLGIGIQTAFSAFGAPFIMPVWVIVDLVVVVLIASPRMTVCDHAVIALFLPAWCFYLIDGWGGYNGSLFVASAQMFLTLPCVPVRRGVRWLRSSYNSRGDGMPFVAARGTECLIQ